MIKKEMVVIGAGPAGLSSAIEAAKEGVEVLLVDENLKAGGQLFKQIHKFFGSSDHRAGLRGINIGKELINESRQLGVDIWLNSIVIGIFDNKQVLIKQNIDGKENLKTVQADKIVIATGASEKVINFKNWTLPGVMGAGAAQTMINVHRVLPGKRFLMIGTGNVGLIVSYQLLQAGAEVVGILDAAKEVGGYNVHATKIARKGVPFYLNHTIIKAVGNNKEGVTGAVIAEVDNKWQPISDTEKELKVDVITLAAGLKPLLELANMADCKRTYISELGGWVPLHNENMESTISGIYVIGDLTGVEEANTALEEGRLAGVDVAEKLGKMTTEQSKIKKKNITQRVKNLRLGPFGEKRLKAKKRLIKEYYKISDKEYKNNFDFVKEIKDELDQKKMIKSANNIDKTKSPVAVIECNQEIPCNPCELACKFDAIKIGEPITNIPILNKEKCTGCGLCLPRCPGLAIFLVDRSYSLDKSTVAFPYEFKQIPQKGDIVDAVDRQGNYLCKAEVVKVLQSEKFDKTPIITISVLDKYIDDARNIRISD
ncbi:MAG: FAD-dependent oxidoreductase [Halanaerobiales bacterium]|nr:FAD-dependent oxidoreductase [Halanaerobiales bacterium]